MITVEQLVKKVGSQAELARIAMVSDGAVCNWMKGRKQISAEAAIRLEVAGIATIKDLRPDLWDRKLVKRKTRKAKAGDMP